MVEAASFAVCLIEVTFHDSAKEISWLTKSFLQDQAMLRCNGPHYVSAALSMIYMQEKDVRVLDCASGTGLVAEKVGIPVV